jgi:hypothetical protein
MKPISEAVDEARRVGHAKRGRCSMCAVGDRPHKGVHDGPPGINYECGNAVSCLACKGDLPPGEQCQACGRINVEDVIC